MKKEEINEQKESKYSSILRNIPIRAIIFPPVGIIMLLNFIINKLKKKDKIKGEKENG